ncbi:MAG TPA: hypothetical protein VKC60_00400 [Opitutaceae bacterium]|nr:hypothetical protein [Opitutaceae bacterium]
MNTKIPTVLILSIAMQWVAIATPTHTATPAPARENPGDMIQPFVVTVPRITSRDLQLRVVANLDVRPLHNSADQALANRFQTEFVAKGFKGNVDFLSATDTPISTLPLLNVVITDWRARVGKMPECVFSATLVTSMGTKQLGTFEGVSKLPDGIPGAEARTNALRASASNAIDEVYHDLQSTHVLSGASD